MPASAHTFIFQYFNLPVTRMFPIRYQKKSQTHSINQISTRNFKISVQAHSFSNHNYFIRKKNENTHGLAGFCKFT